MKLTDEEIDVLREAIDCLLAKKAPLDTWTGKRIWPDEDRHRRTVAEDLYSRLRLEAVRAR